MTAASSTSGSDAQADHLKADSLGATSIAFLVVAAAAPLTVMAGVSPLAILIGGIGAPVDTRRRSVLTIFGVGFMAMTRHTGGAGAFYSYISLGLGRRLGMAVRHSRRRLLQRLADRGLRPTRSAGLRRRRPAGRRPLPGGCSLFAAMVVVWFVGRRGIDVGARILGSC